MAKRKHRLISTSGVMWGLLPATVLVPLGGFLRQHCCQSQLSSSAASHAQLSIPVCHHWALHDHIPIPIPAAGTGMEQLCGVSSSCMEKLKARGCHAVPEQPSSQQDGNPHRRI